MSCSWTAAQQQRLSYCIDNGATIAYWNSNTHGLPVNGGFHNYQPVYPGLIQEVSPPLELCSKHALHATLDPLIWRGSRIWIVALWGEIQSESNKLGSLKREILGEIMPWEAFDPRIGAKLGRKDLRGANLSGADLFRADLSSTNLHGANLSYADLRGADLSRANLSRANLYNADLSRANLYNADLSSADLSYADLSGTNLDNVIGYKK